MTTPVILAFCGAALIAMGSSLFGVGVARMFWADDLRETKHLETYWKDENTSLKESISAQDKTIAILKERLGEH